jgi:hypothetical protein
MARSSQELDADSSGTVGFQEMCQQFKKMVRHTPPHPATPRPVSTPSPRPVPRGSSPRPGQNPCLFTYGFGIKAGCAWAAFETIPSSHIPYAGQPNTATALRACGRACEVRVCNGVFPEFASTDEHAAHGRQDFEPQIHLTMSDYTVITQARAPNAPWPVITATRDYRSDPTFLLCCPNLTTPIW